MCVQYKTMQTVKGPAVSRVAMGRGGQVEHGGHVGQWSTSV